MIKKVSMLAILLFGLNDILSKSLPVAKYNRKLVDVIRLLSEKFILKKAVSLKS